MCSKCCVINSDSSPFFPCSLEISHVCMPGNETESQILRFYITVIRKFVQYVCSFLYWTRNFFCKIFNSMPLFLSSDRSHFIHISGAVRVLPDWFLPFDATSSLKLQMINRKFNWTFAFCSFPGGYEFRESIWISEQNLHLDFSGIVWTCL